VPICTPSSLRTPRLFQAANSADGDGSSCSGRDGVPQATGRLVYASGDIYTGNFKNGRPDGEGRFAWKIGDVFTSQWLDGLKEGAAIIFSLTL
jgi:hypothetical protein